MRYATLLLSAFLFLSFSNMTKAQDYDTLQVEKHYIDVGEQFYTDYFTGYGVYTKRSFFEDTNGGLHIAFLSNYKLYYYYSSDDGINWTGEQIVTGLEGQFRYAVIYADANSTPYIGVTINPYYNYGNPTNIKHYNQEFRFNNYMITKVDGAWTKETVYISNEGNYGFYANEIYMENDGSIKLVGARAGWWDYGGDLWEFTRTSQGVWSTKKTLYKYSGYPVDRGVYINTYSILYDDGTKDLIFGRNISVNKNTFESNKYYSELAKMHYDGTNWSNPVPMVSNLKHPGHWDMTLNGSGHVWVAYFLNDPQPTVVLFDGLESSTTLSLDLTGIEKISTIAINYTKDGLLTLVLFSPAPAEGINYRHAFVSADLGKTWSPQFIIDPSSLIGTVYATTDQYSSNVAGFKYIGITRVSNTEPYGPDSLFFIGANLAVKATLGIDKTNSIVSKLSLHPNPAKNIININYSLDQQNIINLNIYGVDGRILYSKSSMGDINNPTIKLNIDFLRNGTYILEFYEGSDKSERKRHSIQKFIKQ